MRYLEERGVLRALDQGGESLSQFTHRLQLGPPQIKEPRVDERWDELRGLTNLLAQRERARVDCFHFWGCKAFRVRQWPSKGDLQREFLLHAFSGVWQGLEQLQPPGEVSNRFHIGRALGG